MTPQQAADGLLDYIKRLVPERGVALLAGNSVHADQAFLKKEPYKRVLDHLHYRILDVSSIKEAARRWWYVALYLSSPLLHDLLHCGTGSSPRQPGLVARGDWAEEFWGVHQVSH